MSLLGKWTLEETTGNILEDTSANGNNGTTNGTLTGDQGILLTESQTINIPVSLSSETSMGIFLFINSDMSVSDQVVLSNLSSDESDSLVIGINPLGIPYVSHLGNHIDAGNPIDSSETHIGYRYDYEYNIQYLHINGVLTSTSYGSYGSYGSNQTGNNSNTLILGSSFSGTVRELNIYSGMVESNVPEGLAKGLDPSFILPSGTVYASRVEESGSTVHKGVVYRSEIFTSDSLSATKAHYVHDEEASEVNQSSSIQYKADSTSASTGTINLKVREESKMETHVEIRSDRTRIGTGDARATLDVSGLRFNSDSAGLHFGENQEFRISMTSDSPSRLRFQSYDSSSGQYVTKYSILNH